MLSPQSELFDLHPIFGVILGFIIGILFIICTKSIIDRFGHPTLSDFDVISANKIFLIIFVMTLHSISEGIGIGVSFGNRISYK